MGWKVLTFPAHNPINSMAVVQVFLVCPAVFANLMIISVCQCPKALDSRPGEKDRRQGLKDLEDEVDSHELLVVVGPRERV
jgi:hypothetical protein